MRSVLTPLSPGRNVLICERDHACTRIIIVPVLVWLSQAPPPAVDSGQRPSIFGVQRDEERKEQGPPRSGFSKPKPRHAKINKSQAGRSAAAHIRPSMALRSERCTYMYNAQGSMAVRGTAEMMPTLVSAQSPGLVVHAGDTCRVRVQAAAGVSSLSRRRALVCQLLARLGFEF